MRRVDKALKAVLQQLNVGAVYKAEVRLKKARKYLRKHLPPKVPPLPSLEIEGHQPTEENHG